MGYETQYNLIIKGDYEHERMIEVFEEYDIINYALDENFESYGGVKWYDHERDMINISKRFPQLEFILEGNGEESPDFWKKKFKNGSVWEAKGFIEYKEYELLR